MRTQRQWTVMLVPHGSGSSRAVTASHSVLATLGSLGALLALVVTGLGVAAFARAVSISRHRGLEHQNQVLLNELQQVRDQLAVLRDSLDSVSQRGQALRLLADLSPLDPGVQLGGIGGPRGAWPERDSLISVGPVGEQLLAMRLDLDGLTRRAHIIGNSLGQTFDSLSSHETRFAATPSIMPARGRISSPFALQRLNPVLHVIRRHEGIDVAAPMGSDIIAAAAGVVVTVKWEEGYGNLVALDHGYGVVTRYAHCSKILVARGEHVARGQKIALVGSTGESTGPHVHYEVWVNGQAINPKQFLLPEDAITD